MKAVLIVICLLIGACSEKGTDREFAKKADEYHRSLKLCTEFELEGTFTLFYRGKCSLHIKPRRGLDGHSGSITEIDITKIQDKWAVKELHGRGYKLGYEQGYKLGKKWDLGEK